jgi:hypothetical protein
VRRRVAIWAIVRARLRSQRRTLASCCIASIIVGFIQPHGIAVSANPFAADLATRGVWLAGPTFFCSLIGVIVASMQRGAGMRQLELCEQSAPLYGRELARATALVPCIIASIAALAYWGAQFVSGFAAPPTFFLLAFAAVQASTLVALSATLRHGPKRWFYVLLALMTTAIAYLLAVYVDTFGPVPHSLGHYPDAIGVATELIFCALVGFLALRQYGEALARYDPIPKG